MDLLETILRTAHAVSYLELFRKSSVDCLTLQTFSDRDLEIVGVDDPEARKRILEKTSTLMIPREKKVDCAFDEKYILDVLTQASRNLNLHGACVTCATARKDVVLCDIKLRSATETLLNCLSSFEDQVQLFKHKLLKKEKKEKKFGNFAAGFVIVLGTSTLSLFMIRNFVLK